MTDWMVVLLAIGLCSPFLANAAEPGTPTASPAIAADQKRQEVTRAVEAFYRALHAHDIATIASLVPPQGFSEFSSRGGLLKQQTLESVRAVFAAGAQVDVRLEKLQIDLLSPEVALVTGLRIGVVSLGSVPAVPQTKRMTSLWKQEAGQWRLTHVHYSALD